MKSTILTAAAFALLATSASEAQTNHRDRARERFCITRGGCMDDAAIVNALEAKDNARRTAAENLNAQRA